MHLREACRAERRGVDVLEDLVRRASVFVFQHAQHRVVGHGVGVGAQFGEFVAEGLRQNLGAHRQYLADFHERRAERFEHQPHFDRREPVHGIEVVGDARDLHEPPQLAASGEVVALREGVFARAEDADGFARHEWLRGVACGIARGVSPMVFRCAVRGAAWDVPRPARIVRRAGRMRGGVRRWFGRGIDDRVDPVGKRDRFDAFRTGRIRPIGLGVHRHIAFRT